MSIAFKTRLLVKGERVQLIPTCCHPDLTLTAAAERNFVALSLVATGGHVGALVAAMMGGSCLQSWSAHTPKSTHRLSRPHGRQKGLKNSAFYYTPRKKTKVDTCHLMPACKQLGIKVFQPTFSCPEPACSQQISCTGSPG